MTSTYPLMYGGYKTALSHDRTVLAEPFEQKGYETAGFHSNLFLSEEFGYNRGFDTFYDSKPELSPLEKVRELVKDRLDSDGIVFNLLARGVEQAERNVGINLGSLYMTADSLTDLAISWLDEVDTTKSRFLWVHYMDPHHPYVPPATIQETFRENPVSDRRALKLRRKMIDEPSKITDEEQQLLFDLYDAELRFTDDQIGRLIERFRSQCNDSPLIVLTGDHGEAFGEHGLYSHHSTFFDEVINVPLVINNGTEPEVHHELVALLDVPATIVKQVLGSKPESYLGHDLSEILSDGQWERSKVISEVESGDGTMVFSVRTDRWKFIDKSEGSALYDLKYDLAEKDDVSEDHPETVARFQSILDDHREVVISTAQDTQQVEMSDSVRQRLKDLGYHEE